MNKINVNFVSSIILIINVIIICFYTFNISVVLINTLDFSR